MKQARIFILLWIGLFTILSLGSLEAEPIEVKKIGEADLKSILASYKGKVLLVNIWATWCKPCREEFPDLVRLQDFYKGKAVHIIAISANYPDEINSKILPFLENLKSIFLFMSRISPVRRILSIT